MEFACGYAKVRWRIWGWKVLPFGNMAAEAWHYGGNAQAASARGSHFITLALVPVSRPRELPQLSFSGSAVVIELELPTSQVGLALSCRIHATARDVAELQRRLNRSRNDRRSGSAIAGMILLLAICGWIVDGEDGACRAVGSGLPFPDDSPVPFESTLRQFGARPLYPAEMPPLFDVLREIGRRAGLPAMPDLYYLPAAGAMNAYALGGPRRPAIALTDGLLRGMTLNEIAAILAHEVAHIRNGDASAMTWASTLRHAIALTSLTAVAALQGRDGLAGRPLAALLNCASGIGQLLYLALSRIRELDADATALDLIDDPGALASALHKLERHHNGAHHQPAVWPDDGLIQFLRSHPATCDRVGMLRRLAQ